MKKLVAFVLILSALLCTSACGKKSEDESSEPSVQLLEELSSVESDESSEEAVAKTTAADENIQLAEKTAYKDEYVDNSGNVIEDWYSKDGVILYSTQKDTNGMVYAERFYDAEGKLIKLNEFDESGEISATVTFAYEAENKVVWTLYDAEGNFSEKNTAMYDGNKISSVITCDEDDVCFAEQFFTYDSEQKLEKTDTFYYSEGVTTFILSNVYDKESGSVKESTESYYDEAGNYLYKDVYGIVGGKYGFIGRYNSAGELIPNE